MPRKKKEVVLEEVPEFVATAENALEYPLTPQEAIAPESLTNEVISPSLKSDISDESIVAAMHNAFMSRIAHSRRRGHLVNEKQSVDSKAKIKAKKKRRQQKKSRKNNR